MASRIALLCLLGLLLVASKPAIADDSGIYYQLDLMVWTGSNYFFTHYMYFVLLVSLIEIGPTIAIRLRYKQIVHVI